MSPQTGQRICCREKDFQPLAHKSKQICLPIDQDEYNSLLGDPKAFRSCVDELNAEFPELFPSTMKQGYHLHDLLPESKKMPGVRLRRIKVLALESDQPAEVFTIRPSFVLPYMMGYTDAVELPLFFRKFAVPYWALVYGFGRDEKYWYRLENRFGRNSLVGTTLKDGTKLPADVLADEKHTHFNGEKAYIAMTVADNCVLGASITLSADAPALTEAYGHFKTEAQNLEPDYAPQTVNTDGWTATQLAWLALFPTIIVILCFLHAFLKIRSGCKRLKPHYQAIKTRVWAAYHAPDPFTFMKEVATLNTWAILTLPQGKPLAAILKLVGKTPQFVKAYGYPSAYRTSNMLDRQMDAMDRYLANCRYFHGHLMSAEYGIRAWVLLHNFQPYCPQAKVAKQYQSPAHKLNGRVYHENWLHNLLISASMGGYCQ